MRSRIAVIALALWMMPAWAETPINELADAHPKGDVEISNVSGEVVVTGWDREQIEVTGTLGRGSERLEFVSDGRHTLIKVVIPRRSHNVSGSDLQIRVPEQSRVSVTGRGHNRRRARPQQPHGAPTNIDIFCPCRG